MNFLNWFYEVFSGKLFCLKVCDNRLQSLAIAKQTPSEQSPEEKESTQTKVESQKNKRTNQLLE